MSSASDPSSSSPSTTLTTSADPGDLLNHLNNIFCPPLPLSYRLQFLLQIGLLGIPLTATLLAAMVRLKRARHQLWLFRVHWTAEGAYLIPNSRCLLSLCIFVFVLFAEAMMSIKWRVFVTGKNHWGLLAARSIMYLPLILGVNFTVWGSLYATNFNGTINPVSAGPRQSRLSLVFILRSPSFLNALLIFSSLALLVAPLSAFIVAARLGDLAVQKYYEILGLEDGGRQFEAVYDGLLRDWEREVWWSRIGFTIYIGLGGLLVITHLTVAGFLFSKITREVNLFASADRVRKVISHIQATTIPIHLPSYPLHSYPRLQTPVHPLHAQSPSPYYMNFPSLSSEGHDGGDAEVLSITLPQPGLTPSTEYLFPPAAAVKPSSPIPPSTKLTSRISGLLKKKSTLGSWLSKEGERKRRTQSEYAERLWTLKGLRRYLVLQTLGLFIFEAPLLTLVTIVAKNITMPATSLSPLLLRPAEELLPLWTLIAGVSMVSLYDLYTTLLLPQPPCSMAHLSGNDAATDCSRSCIFSPTASDAVYANLQLPKVPMTL